MDFYFEDFYNNLILLTNSTSNEEEINNSNNYFLNLSNNSIYHFIFFSLKIIENNELSEILILQCLLFLKHSFRISIQTTLESIQNIWFSLEFQEIRELTKNLLFKYIFIENEKIQDISINTICQLYLIEDSKWNDIYENLFNSLKILDINISSKTILKFFIELFQTNYFFKIFTLNFNFSELYDIILNNFLNESLQYYSFNCFLYSLRKIPQKYFELEYLINFFNLINDLLPKSNINLFKIIFNILNQIIETFYHKSTDFFLIIFDIVMNLLCNYNFNNNEYILIIIDFWHKLAKFEYKYLLLNNPDCLISSQSWKPSNYIFKNDSSTILSEHLTSKSLYETIDIFLTIIGNYDESINDINDFLNIYIPLTTSKYIKWGFLHSPHTLHEKLINYIDLQLSSNIWTNIAGGLLVLYSISCKTKFLPLIPFINENIPKLFNLCTINNNIILFLSLFCLETIIKIYFSDINIEDLLNLQKYFNNSPIIIFEKYLQLFRISIKRLSIKQINLQFENILNIFYNLMLENSSNLSILSLIFDNFSTLFLRINSFTNNFTKIILTFYETIFNFIPNLINDFIEFKIEKICFILNLGIYVCSSTLFDGNEELFNFICQKLLYLLEFNDLSLYENVLILFSSFILYLQKALLPYSIQLLEKINYAFESHSPRLIGIAALTFGDLIRNLGLELIDNIENTLIILFDLLNNSTEEFLKIYHYRLIISISSSILGLKENFPYNLFESFFNHLKINLEIRFDIYNKELVEYYMNLFNEILEALNRIFSINHLFLDNFDLINLFIKSFINNFLKFIYQNQIYNKIFLKNLFNLIKNIGLKYNRKVNIILNHRQIHYFIEKGKLYPNEIIRNLSIELNEFIKNI